MKLYIEPCAEYPLHKLVITDWLAEEKGFDTKLTGTIVIVSDLENAYRIEIGTKIFHSHQELVPKSQCEIVERTGPKK
jgi:hypothetical protein